MWYVALVRALNDEAGAADESLDPVHLKATVVALREALNQARQNRDNDIAASRSAADAEIAQLRATVRTLREALEAVNESHLKKVEEAEARFGAERRELEGTIRLMREQLEERE